MSKKLLPLTAMIATANMSNAIVFDLDLTGATGDYNQANSTLTILATDVATVDSGTPPNIDLFIESIDTYTPQSNNAGNNQNGNPTGVDDLRVHIGNNTETRFRLSLFNSGTQNLYDPGESFSFTFVVYDIDGNVSNDPGADRFIIYAPVTYTATPTTTVAIEELGTGISFTGTAGQVSTQEGVTTLAPGEQQDSSIAFEIEDLSQFEFSFGAEVTAPSGNPVARGRNLLIDAQDLTVNGTPITFNPVPEPNAYAMIIGVIGLAIAGSRRRKID